MNLPALHLAWPYLYKGDFERGWKQHEIHLQSTNKNAPELRKFLATQSLAGKIILIRPDGGMGDVIQFIRYAQLLNNQGARVIAAVQKPLVPLLSRCPYLEKVIATSDPLPLCHDWCPVMSLPAVFYSTHKTIPLAIPYIFPDPERVDYWAKSTNEKNDVLKIGICWQADVHNDSSRPPFARRGMPLKEFFCLDTIPGIHFFSLQQKDGTEQLAQVPCSFPLTVFDDSFDNVHGPFMDTAALMPNLHLVITVDTAVAHLAGALGVASGFYCLFAPIGAGLPGVLDLPWYGSMRIFKQKKAFDWSSVMQEVRDALAELVTNESTQ